MSLETKAFLRWKHALSTSESIADDLQKKALTKREILAYLESLDEAFARAGDPLDDFQGFVLAHLCRSLRRAIENL